ncbi:Signal peptidase complex subunit 2 [Rhizophlyctis rosea]|nr:Signal peptidase complex subunit 2 [Rhizophlyctis rosea]
MAEKFIEEYDKSPVIITPYNGVELKHNTDDAVRKLFTTTFGYKESTTHSDMRLILGYSACFFAAAGAAYSYKVPFPDCRPLLAVCVVAYFILNGAMILYAQYIEKDIIFVGSKTDRLGVEPPKTITIHSDTPRFSSSYTLTFEITSTKPSSKSTPAQKTSSLKSHFGAWFDTEGRFFPRDFHADVVKAVGSQGTLEMKGE